MATNYQFIEESHTYLNALGHRVPSVTQIMDGVGLVDYSMVDEDVLARKAEIGDAAHKACHFHDEGDLDLSSVDPLVLPYVNAWIRFRAETNFRPELIEHQGVAVVDGMQYGFKLDRVGMFRCRPTVVEIKCTASVMPSWGPQLAGYELAIRPVTNMAIRRMAVHLKPNCKYSLIDYSDAADYHVFRWALGIETWKLAKGKS